MISQDFVNLIWGWYFCQDSYLSNSDTYVIRDDVLDQAMVSAIVQVGSRPFQRSSSKDSFLLLNRFTYLYTVRSFMASSSNTYTMQIQIQMASSRNKDLNDISTSKSNNDTSMSGRGSNVGGLLGVNKLPLFM